MSFEIDDQDTLIQPSPEYLQGLELGKKERAAKIVPSYMKSEEGTFKCYEFDFVRRVNIKTEIDFAMGYVEGYGSKS